MRLPLAALFLALSSAALAQTPVSKDACLPFAKTLPATVTYGTVAVVGTDGCVFERVVVPFSTRMQVSIGRLTVQRLDLAGGAVDKVPPSLRLEAHGLHFGPRTGNALIDYIGQIQSRPMDAVLDYAFDPASATLRFAEIGVDGRAVGHLKLSAEIVGFDPDAVTTPGVPPIGKAALKSLRLHFENLGFFESFVAVPIASALLQDEADPAARMDAIKAQVRAVLPVVLANADPATIAALGDFVSAFPHPDKTLDLTIDLPVPVSVEDLPARVGQPGQIARSLPAGSIKVRYGE